MKIKRWCLFDPMRHAEVYWLALQYIAWETDTEWADERHGSRHLSLSKEAQMVMVLFDRNEREFIGDLRWEMKKRQSEIDRWVL